MADKHTMLCASVTWAAYACNVCGAIEGEPCRVMCPERVDCDCEPGDNVRVPTTGDAAALIEGRGVIG